MPTCYLRSALPREDRYGCESICRLKGFGSHAYAERFDILVKVPDTVAYAAAVGVFVKEMQGLRCRLFSSRGTLLR